MATKKSDEEKFVNLMVETFETGLRGSVTMAKIPLIMCQSFTNSWAKGLESVLDGLQSDSKGS